MDNFTDTRSPRLRSSTPLAGRSTGARRPRRVFLGSDWHDRLTKNADSVTPVQARWFAALMGLAAIAIIAQAAIAGEFVANSSNGGWIFAHGLIAYVTLGSTLAAAVFAVINFRSSQPAITALASGLFGLTLAQTAIGYLITVLGQDALLIVHIPLAFIVFGLTGWLSIRATAITAVSHRRFRG